MEGSEGEELEDLEGWEGLEGLDGVGALGFRRTNLSEVGKHLVTFDTTLATLSHEAVT
jgi:hypothetical protein